MEYGKCIVRFSPANPNVRGERMRNYANGDEIPLGFGMLLVQNAAAMDRFIALSDTKKQSVIDKAARVRSRDEMREYVRQIGEGTIL